MLTNPKYPVGIYLLKASNKNFWTRCVKKTQNKTKKQQQSVDLVLVSSLLTLKRFHTFSQPFTVYFGECCRVRLPTEIKAQTSKNYEICKDRSKSYINQTDQSATWKVTCIRFKKSVKCRLWANIYEIYWGFCSVRITSL